jgi:hypothetical protein
MTADEADDRATAKLHRATALHDAGQFTAEKFGELKAELEALLSQVDDPAERAQIREDLAEPLSWIEPGGPSEDRD